ncbi:hypothetical protein ABDD95_12740 [Mucilaginibacter sp. PAMB04274]|uniref:hypothetical protein n=1 Tax=Mucilaginibacter sp. PAMB04274 TaxID=3138568 RepID=UPI0031F63A2E
MIPKILITVNQGIVTTVATTLTECQVLIVDFDRQSDDPVWIGPPKEQDVCFRDGEASLLFDANDELEADAARQLKWINY